MKHPTAYVYLVYFGSLRRLCLPVYPALRSRASRIVGAAGEGHRGRGAHYREPSADGQQARSE